APNPISIRGRAGLDAGGGGQSGADGFCLQARPCACPLDKNRQQSDSEKDRKFLYRPGLVILYLGRDASKLGWDNASAAERERAAAFPRNPDDPSGISCSGP